MTLARANENPGSSAYSHPEAMPLNALLLVLAAAALHAGWNYFAKSAGNTVALLWWSVTLGTLGYGLVLLATTGIFLPREVWGFYAISAFAEVGYFITLVRGYRHGDLSLVYPLSRGSAPIFITVWSAIFLQERLPLGGYFGIGLLTVGIYVVSLQPETFVPVLSWTNRAVLWALASGFFISVYSLSDKIIVSAMPPLVYNWWVYAGIAVLCVPVVWTPRQRAGNMIELRTNLSRIVVSSVMNIVGYVAVLIALTQTSASYVVAGRGTSVVIAALLGWLALRERLGRVRVSGALLMVMGLALLALAQ